MKAVSPSGKTLAILLVAVMVVVVGTVATDVRLASRQKEMAAAMTGGDPDLAPPLFRRYGCTGCHSIRGIPGADGQVGGPLDGIAHRVYVGGAANNSAGNLIAWIVSPQRFSPNSAMPATGISEQDARHLAAYLYSH